MFPYNYMVLSVLSAIAAATLAFYISIRSARRDLGLRFSLWTISIVIISLGDALRKSSADYDFALFWTKFTVLGAIVFIPTFAEFCLTFPPRKEPLRTRFLYSSIAVSVALAALLPTNILVQGLVGTPMGWHTNFGPGLFLFGPVFALFSIVSFAELVKKTHRRAAYYRTHVIALGVLIAIGLVTTLIPPIQELLYDPPMLSILSLSATILLGNLVLRQKFLVIPIAETSSETSRRSSLEKGECYVVIEDKPNRSIEFMAAHVAHGSPGLCITKMPPEQIKDEFSLSKTPIFWLSELDLPNTLHPTDIETLLFYAKSFYENTKEGVLLLQGLEYLVEKNSLATVLKLMKQLKKSATKRSGLLIVSILKDSLDQDTLDQLKDGLTQL